VLAAHAQYIVAPRLNTSVCCVTGRRFTLLRGNVVRRALNALLDRPHLARLAEVDHLHSPVDVSRMLIGFRSQCTYPAVMYFSALAT